MLVVTARIFDKSQLIGYELQNENGEKGQFTKQQVWGYAKQKMIQNVKASGTEQEPVISGTNGFELKRLPEIKWSKPALEITNYDAYAAINRGLMDGGSLEELSTIPRSQCIEAIKLFLETSGELHAGNKNTLSNSIKVIRVLRDDITHEMQITTNPEGTLNNKPFKTVDAVTGYRIKNIGNQPIPITRITVTPEHTKTQVILNPNCEINLSRAEAAGLCSIPEIGNIVANGKFYRWSFGKEKDWYTELRATQFTLNDGIAIKDSGLDIPLSQIETPENIWKYFCDTEAYAKKLEAKRKKEAEAKKQKEAEAKAKNKPSKGIGGLMSQFSR